MKGPFQLNEKTIDKNITLKSAGNYALGYEDKDNAFIVEYVGRSDTDLNKRLKDWTDSKYELFKYSYATTAKTAFTKECNNFHDFGGTKKLDNAIHQDRPDKSNWECPRCDIYDEE